MESLSAESDSEAEQEVSGWEGVTPTELLELQEKLLGSVFGSKPLVLARFKSVYKQPVYQKQFSELARKCYPDMMQLSLSVAFDVSLEAIYPRHRGDPGASGRVRLASLKGFEGCEAHAPGPYCWNSASSTAWTGRRCRSVAVT